VNVIPDRVDIDVDIRSLPGIEQHEVEAMIAEALGNLADCVTIAPPPAVRRGGSVSPTDTPLMAAISRVATRLMPDSRVVPAITTGGPTPSSSAGRASRPTGSACTPRASRTPSTR
jgi:acetylornithine deacetylase/succinyl-diaminopimelate desuccinylase-like protein